MTAPFNYHVFERLRERYGFKISPKKILQRIHEGKAKRSRSAFPNSWIWDVEYNYPNGGPLTVRVVTDEEATRIITALPPAFKAEKLHESQKSRTKQFYRHFERENQDETLVTD
jgi:hypothetical protein